jgi:phage baseplate assembly protein W
MKNIHYDLPLRFDLLKKKNAEHPTCNYDKSIAQFIFMLITAHFGEHRYDPSFGSEIWETDFQLIANVNTWKENMRKSVEAGIISHEKRLKDLNVTVDLSEEEIRSPITQILSVKKRVLLRVKAKTVLTGEDFVFETKMFISPLSID